MELTFGSLFAGIGGLDLGFERAGLRCKWQVEIDSSATKTLSHRWPNVERHSDIRTVGAVNLKKVTAVCGGFPCQDLSVAGKRAGLVSGERSGLWWEMLRVIEELQPELVVWENVAGLSSSDAGRDLARVIFSLRDCGYFGCGRLVDAQYFGVAQRRRRWFGVFARGDSGARRATEILSLSEGLRGHPAPSRKEGQGITGGVAPRLRASGVGTERIGDTRGQDCIVPVALTEVCPTLLADSHPGSYTGQDAMNGKLIPMVAHTLTGNGFDASEDGTGRGTPIVPVAYRTTGNDGAYETGDKIGSLTTGTDRTSHLIAIPLDMRQCSRGGTMTNNRSEGSFGGAPGTGIGDIGDPSPTIGISHPPAVAFAIQERAVSTNLTNGPQGKGYQEGIGYTIEARAKVQMVATEYMGVRRLTPMECLRLQGFPDDWFDGVGLSDSQKYRLCGNAVAVPCAEWIGRRIVSSLK